MARRPYHERERIEPSWTLRLKYRSERWWWEGRPYSRPDPTVTTPIRSGSLHMIHTKWTKFRVHKISEWHMVMVLCTYTNLRFFDILALVETFSWPRTSWSHVGEKVWLHTIENKYSCIGERAVYDRLAESIDEDVGPLLPEKP